MNGTSDSLWDVKLVKFLEQLRLSKYLTIETEIVEVRPIFHGCKPSRLDQRLN